MPDTVLFNPISITHDRNVDDLMQLMPGWDARRIYNPRLPWFSGKKRRKNKGIFYFRNFHFLDIPEGLFDGVRMLVFFTAQPRVPVCNLVEYAALNGIPVVTIEETHQMMLEQGYRNNYFLPVDRFFTASLYEEERFEKTGIPHDIMEVAGCMSGYDRSKETEPFDPDALKEQLKIPQGKKIVTLGHHFAIPGGETPEVRRQLLICASKHLPPEYHLLIKPHPSDQDKNFNAIAGRYAPHAAIADKYIPIHKILRISDVLLNRGNSQVVIDALHHSVPVAAIPVGRRTFFHGQFNELVIEKAEDLPKVLRAIENKGMGIFKDLMGKYLCITPSEAMRRIALRLPEVAKENSLYKPAERLSELSLYVLNVGSRCVLY